MTRQALGGVQVADAMTPGPVTAPSDMSVQEFIDRHTQGKRPKEMKKEP